MKSPSWTVDVVSPQFPCGAAWLANAFLELDVALPELWGFDTGREWNCHDGLSTYVATDLPWRQTLASLRVGRTFHFRPDVQPRFSHAFPWKPDIAPRIVLITRDPRDALYSEWQRHRRNLQLPASTGFKEFVQQPFFGGPISNIDMLWLHLHTWLTLRKDHPARIYVLRFEDWKHDPLGALSSLMDWMGFSIAESAGRRATEASDVRHLQTIEAGLEAKDRNCRQFNRRGAANEWRESWDALWFEVFGTHWPAVFKALDYDYVPSAGQAAARLNFDATDVLAWRDLRDPVLVSKWRQVIQDSI